MRWFTPHFLLLFCFSCLPCDRAAAAVAPPLGDVWQHYISKMESFFPIMPSGPGRSVGDAASLQLVAASAHWKWRPVVYELYFESAPELARSVYGLALDMNDIDRDMPLNRFERGGQAFHYDVSQICRWINNVLHERVPVNTPQERRLIDWLFSDGVVDIKGGLAVPGEKVRHILGVAGGKKRSFAINLVHERLHIVWDENEDFRNDAKKRWQTLSEKEKQSVYESLPGYSKDREEQIVEEWAVREAEGLPPERRRLLVGM